jgi:predicted PurR-regulated permease PerM
MKRFAARIAVALAITALAAVCYLRRWDALLLVLALTLTATVQPQVERLAARPMPRALAVAVCYSVSLLVLGGLFSLLAAPLLIELRSGMDEFVIVYERARELDPNAGSLQRLLADALPPISSLYRGVGGAEPTAWAFGALGITANTVGAVSKSLVVLVLSAYWASADRPEQRIGTRLLTLLGFDAAHELWKRTLTNVGDHVRVEIARTVSYVVLLSAGYLAFDLRYWVLPAIAAALLALLPFVGAASAMLVAALAASSRGAFALALAVAFTSLVVLLVEGGIRQALRVRPTHPIVLVLTVLALASSLGLAGVLLAPAVAAALESVGGAVLARNEQSDVDPGLDAIAARLAAMRANLSEAAVVTSPHIATLIDRTAALAARIRQIAR